MTRRDTSAGGTACLGCLELLSVRDASADIINNLSQSGTNRNFHKTRVIDLTTNCKHLCTFTFLRADACEPIGALVEYYRNIGIGLNVIKQRRLLPQTPDRGEWRLWLGLASLSFD